MFGGDVTISASRFSASRVRRTCACRAASIEAVAATGSAMAVAASERTVDDRPQKQTTPDPERSGVVIELDERVMSHPVYCIVTVETFVFVRSRLSVTVSVTI